MKPSSVLLIIAPLATGFIAGMIFSNFSAKQKLVVEKEHLDYLIELHDFQRKRSKEAFIASEEILNKVLRLNQGGIFWSKGKISSDPIKRLLFDSYDCLTGDAQVFHNYDRQVYPEDSAFLKKIY